MIDISNYAITLTSAQFDGTWVFQTETEAREAAYRLAFEGHYRLLAGEFIYDAQSGSLAALDEPEILDDWWVEEEEDEDLVEGV